MLLVLALVLLQSLSNSHSASRSSVQLSSPRRLVERSSSTDSIIIQFYYINFDLGSETANDQFETIIAEEVTDFYSRFLSVKSLTSPLTLLGVDKCGEEIEIPSVHQEWGVWADVLVYVTTNTTEDDFFTTDAIPCAHELEGRRNVLAGRINIHKDNFRALTQSQQVWQITHDVAHILAFDSTLYSLFHKPDGAQFLLSEVVLSTTVRGVPKHLIKSPKVLKEARTVFGCDTLNGVELESDDGEASPGKHWDKRIMFNDFMSAEYGDNPIISTITGSLFEDSGWYFVNWDLTTEPVWGKNRGCDFHNRKCVEDGTTTFPEFCTEPEQACDVYRLHKSECNYFQYPGFLIDAYRYFSDRSIGGGDRFADYCPYFAPSPNGSCRGDGPEPTVLHPIQLGEKTCRNCRCLTGSLLKLGTNLAVDGDYVACYEVLYCTSDRAVISVEDQTTECFFDGGAAYVEGYTGFIKCPESDILCRDLECKDDCNGNGSCVLGICDCKDNFYGDICEFEEKSDIIMVGACIIAIVFVSFCMCIYYYIDYSDNKYVKKKKKVPPKKTKKADEGTSYIQT